MELIPIRLILDDSGNIIDKYTQLPVVNQYATNYKLEVAFLNDMPDTRLIKAIFEINGKSSPARVLSPTLLRINLEDRYSYYSHEYQLTQYETQFFQDELYFNIYVYNSSGTQITSTRVNVPMVKQMFNKLTPAGLDENDSSISSITKSLYDLEAAIINKGIADTESFETKTDAIKKLSEAKEYTDSKIYEVDINSKNYAETVSEQTKTEANAFTENQIILHNNDELAHYDIRTAIKDLQNSKDDVPPNVYTKTEVNYNIETAIARLINSSPDALNTLQELAAAIGNDPNFATSVMNAISKKVNQTQYDTEVGEIQENVSSLQSDILYVLQQLENKLDKASIPVLRIWR